MKRSKSKTSKPGSSHGDPCGEAGPGDGLPPAIYQRRFGEPHGTRKASAHTGQYLKAVFRALDAGLTTTCADPRLAELTIRSVEPLAGGSTLLVLATAPGDPAALVELERVLQGASGLLRSVVAQEIRRKRAPHLRFRVMPES